MTKIALFLLKLIVLVSLKILAIVYEAETVSLVVITTTRPILVKLLLHSFKIDLQPQRKTQSFFSGGSTGYMGKEMKL